MAGSLTCPRCDFPFSPQDKYCGVCGNLVTRPCPRCEHDVPVSSQFCNFCGLPLAPLHPAERLNEQERMTLHRSREMEAFQFRERDFARQLANLERRFRHRRLTELILVGALLGTVFLFLQPYLTRLWVESFQLSRERSSLIALLVGILMILVILYFIDMRRHLDHAVLNELRTRLVLTRQRRDEVQTLWQAQKPVPTDDPSKSSAIPALVGDERLN